MVPIGAISVVEDEIADMEDDAAGPTIAPVRTTWPRKVFLVHGHDEGVREAVARYFEKLEFEVVVLHERANQGRTVIEKVETHSDVGFAVVRLTPGDEGCVKGGTLGTPLSLS